MDDAGDLAPVRAPQRLPQPAMILGRRGPEREAVRRALLERRRRDHRDDGAALLFQAPDQAIRGAARVREDDPRPGRGGASRAGGAACHCSS